jgi:hypothetical protein
MKKDIEKYEVDYLTGKGDKGDLSNTALRIESEQLRKDNQKLLDMLKGTKETLSLATLLKTRVVTR